MHKLDVRNLNPPRVGLLIKDCLQFFIDRLSLRKQIIEFKKTEANAASAEFFKNISAERWQLMLDKGVKPLKFSKADGEAFLKLAYDAAWDYVIAKSPEIAPKLKKMLVK